MKHFAILTLLFAQENEAPKTAGFLDWEGPWCVYRICIWIFLCITSWFICRSFFGNSLRNNKSLYPTQAMGNCFAWFWFTVLIQFVIAFRFIGSELVLQNPKRLFPISLNWLNIHWPWILAILIGLSGYIFIKFFFRKPNRSKA